MNTTVVACCQVAPALADPAANRELAAHAISHAAAQGASVVILPELVSSGYVFESRAEATASAETADGATVTLWARLRSGPRRNQAQHDGAASAGQPGREPQPHRHSPLAGQPRPAEPMG